MEGEAHTWLATAFAYEFANTPVGLIPRPIVPVTFTGTDGRPLNVECLTDSGSDITLLPLSLGQLLGFNPQPKTSTYGVSGSTSGEIFNMQVTIAGQTMTVPVLITMNDDSPPLVGRAGAWSMFKSITFDNNAGATCFGEPTTPLNQFLINPNVWVISGAIVAGFVLWAVLK